MFHNNGSTWYVYSLPILNQEWSQIVIIKLLFLFGQEGREDMYYIMSYEYQRMWLTEREAWHKRMFPDNTVNVDIVKRYVQTFKNNHQPPKPEEKKPFVMKK